MTTTITTDLRARWRFFHAEAGWATPPGKVACAMILARAEEWAVVEGVEYEWAEDDCIESSDFRDDVPAYPLWVCVARLGDAVESLGGIDFGPGCDPWGEPYKRVVEAELAAQLQDRMTEVLVDSVLSL